MVIQGRVLKLEASRFKSGKIAISAFTWFPPKPTRKDLASWKNNNNKKKNKIKKIKKLVVDEESLV